MRLKLFSSREYNIAKLNLIKAFKKAKKLALISGKELKSVVIRGKLELKIIPTRVDKKSGLIAVFNFDKTNVKRDTNYCSFVYGIQSSKSFSNLPKGKIKLFKMYSASSNLRSVHLSRYLM